MSSVGDFLCLPGDVVWNHQHAVVAMERERARWVNR